MNFQVTRTKIIPPRRRSDLLSRQRLLGTLYELIDFRLIILIAPAGYGKTFLLVDFAHSTELPVCWYALDPLDQDLYRFFAHFIASIKEQFPEYGRASAAALESLANGQGSLEQFIATVVNDIYEHIHEHFVLIIDDFFLVEDNPDLSHFISRFVQQVDENCHIVLASRKLLNIPDMALLIARGYVGGMDYEDMAFEVEELQELTHKSFGYAMPTEEATSLITATDGWIIGLLLSAQSKLRSISGRMRLMRASGLDLYDYLAEQVLNQQPALIRDFLLRTSLLEEFDAKLCAVILGEEWRPPTYQWSELIAEVLRRNLFVLPLGEDSAWLRYNHVFQDFLQKRLTKVHPNEERIILERLAAYYRDQQEWEKAHYYLNKLGEIEAVADLIESAGLHLLYGGRFMLLNRWLQDLPAGFLNDRAVLLALQGDVAINQGQMSEGLATLNEAMLLLEKQENLVHKAHTLVRRAVAQRRLGNYEAALADTNQVIELLAGVEKENPNLTQIYALALRSKGTVLCTVGETETGIPLLQKALQIYQEIRESYNVASITQDTAVSYLQMGRYGDALDLFERALVVWQEASNLSGQALVLNNIGYLYHMQGDYETALTHLERALDHGQRSGNLRAINYALISMGDLFTDLELWTAAQEVYQQAEPVTKRINEQYLFLSLELALARLASLQEDWETVYTHLDQASDLVISKKSGYEWGLYRLAVGRCHLLQKRITDAIEPLEDAKRYFKVNSHPTEAASTYFLLFMGWHEAGDQAQSRIYLQQGLDLLAAMENHHALLPTLRMVQPLLQHKKVLALDARAEPLLAEINEFETAIPQKNRKLRRVASPAMAKVLEKAPEFCIRALGRVEVTVGNKSITTSDWQTVVSRNLFLCLLAHPEGLTKEQIGLLFWPDASPNELKTRFKNAIYRLRNALRQDVVIYTDDIYHYNWAIDYQYDVEDFLQKIGEGDRATDKEAQMQAYQMALSIYRGPYLPDVDGSWVWSMREHLERMFMDTALTLTTLYYEAESYSEALDSCQRVLAEDPCLEDAHRLAMQIHAAAGNRVAVARQFALCQQALQDEIDAPPSPQTEELYLKLMQ